MGSSLLLLLPNNIPLIDTSCYKTIKSPILQKKFSCLKIMLIMQYAMNAEKPIYIGTIGNLA